MHINFKVHYWPGLFFVWFWLTCLISYIVAKTQGYIPQYPFISELGAWLPASTIFGQMVNIGALFKGIVVYLRYQQVDLAINTNTTNLNKLWNERSKWLGFVTAFGLTIVANFQGNVDIHPAVITLHFTGAFAVFGIGGIYLILQLKITFDLRPYYKRFPQFGVSKSLQYFRLILAIAFFISYILVVAFVVVGLRESKGDHVQALLPGDNGYNSRLVSVFAEWSLVVIYLLNILTITNELKAIKFVGICFKRAEPNLENNI